jgi:hypothetical protein
MSIAFTVLGDFEPLDAVIIIMVITTRTQVVVVGFCDHHKKNI